MLKRARFIDIAMTLVLAAATGLSCGDRRPVAINNGDGGFADGSASEDGGDGRPKDDAGEPGDGGRNPDVHAPQISAFAAVPATITSGGSVTFTALVTDADGDIAGGSLFEGSTFYGTFALSGSKATLTLTWNQFNTIRALSFDSPGQSRQFVASFVDQTGRSAGSSSVTITFTCGDKTACTGACVDLRYSSSHCAMCGHSCGDGNACMDKICKPVSGECRTIPANTMTSCREICSRDVNYPSCVSPSWCGLPYAQRWLGKYCGTTDGASIGTDCDAKFQDKYTESAKCCCAKL